MKNRFRHIPAVLMSLALTTPAFAAEVVLKLVEYRKPDPGPIEEMLFFDHPSARTRIFNAMRWKALMTPQP